MTGTTISPLRQRMIEDMTLRSFDPHTQSGYIRAVKKLAAFLGRSPDEASAEDLRRFQIHLRQTSVRSAAICLSAGEEEVFEPRPSQKKSHRSGGGFMRPRHLE